MAFQDNSGDIILDVVLTDEGRKRLAKGDGSFRITKFALSDDEINYQLYDYDASTANKDLAILQTPVLEAFTDNAASCKSKLMTLHKQNLMYLPILKLNTVSDGTSTSSYSTAGNYVVAVNDITEDGSFQNTTTSIGFDSVGSPIAGVLFGQNPDIAGGWIRVDAGIDSTDTTTIDPSMVETQFQIEIDNRLGSIVDKSGKTNLSYVSVDDDDIAVYIVSKNSDPKFVTTPGQRHQNATSSPINGPLASALEFKIRSSTGLRQSNYLFNKIGSTSALENAAGASPAIPTIDSIVRVSGLTTGYAIDIPVRFAKVS